MPWKTISLVRTRQQLAEAVLAGRHSLQSLSRRFGVSRKTAYKWLKRFRHGGASGLRDRSRRPKRSPDQISGFWSKQILSWRRRRPHWGAKKIQQRLRRLFPRRHLPCVRSVHRCLQRHQQVRRRPRRARQGPGLPAPGLTPARCSNQVWTVDFKGWFRTAAILDSQSVKSAGHGGAVGYDAAKQIRGRKRHLLVDTPGLVLGVALTPANVSERDGAKALLARVLGWFTWLRVLWADGGYTGEAFAQWVKGRRPKLTVEVVKRSDAKTGFHILPRRWIVERTFGWCATTKPPRPAPKRGFTSP